jgi:hypothetical protein
VSLQKLTSKGYIYLRDYFEQIHAVLEKIESCQSSASELEEAAQEILKGVFLFLFGRSIRTFNPPKNRSVFGRYGCPSAIYFLFALSE